MKANQLKKDIDQFASLTFPSKDPEMREIAYFIEVNENLMTYLFMIVKQDNNVFMSKALFVKIFLVFKCDFYFSLNRR